MLLLSASYLGLTDIVTIFFIPGKFEHFYDLILFYSGVNVDKET